MKIRIPFIVFVYISAFRLVDAYGQTGSDSIRYLPEFRTPRIISSRDVAGESEIDIDNWVEETGKDISRVRPGSFSPNPSADRQVVRSVYNQLKAKRAPLGFSQQSILKSLFTAWVTFAVKGFDQYGKEIDYTVEELLDKALRTCELSIHTAPEGATIIIDNYKGYSVTNTSVMVDEGKHNVVISKSGYADHKQSIDVKTVRFPLIVALKPRK